LRVPDSGVLWSPRTYPIVYPLCTGESMSIDTDIETGRARIYDERGRTLVPKKVRKRQGWSKGTKLKFVSDGDEVRVVEVDE